MRIRIEVRCEPEQAKSQRQYPNGDNTLSATGNSNETQLRVNDMRQTGNRVNHRDETETANAEKGRISRLVSFIRSENAVTFSATVVVPSLILGCMTYTGISNIFTGETTSKPTAMWYLVISGVASLFILLVSYKKTGWGDLKDKFNLHLLLIGACFLICSIVMSAMLVADSDGRNYCVDSIEFCNLSDSADVVPQ